MSPITAKLFDSLCSLTNGTTGIFVDPDDVVKEAGLSWHLHGDAINVSFMILRDTKKIESRRDGVSLFDTKAIRVY